MKILHLSSEKTWRGGEQQLAYLLAELPKPGAECVVACRKNTAFEEYCKKNNQEYVALPFANEFDLVTALGIKKICKEKNIDVVHAHSSHSHALAVWAHLLGNKPPIVLHRRVDFPVKDKALSRFKYNYSGIEAIICVSDMVKKILAPALKAPQKCVTIYDGIDLAKFPKVGATGILRKEFNIPEDVAVVANIAALTHQKDYHTFIDTVKILVQQNTKAAFLAIGQGHLETELKNYAQQQGVAQNIIFTGFRNDIPHIFPELDVLLFSSRTEGLGSTILDAFACGVPVVSTDAGGIPEIVTHQETGLLAPVGNAAALAKNVQRVLTDKDLAARLKKAGMARVKDFSKEKIAAQTLLVYRQILSR